MANNDIVKALWINLHNAKINDFQEILGSMMPDQIQYLINSYDPVFKTGWTFLHYAVYLIFRNKADINFVRTLLANNADSMKSEKYNAHLTPFHYAVGVFHLPEVVTLFLDHCKEKPCGNLDKFFESKINNKLPLTYALTVYPKLKNNKPHEFANVIKTLVVHGINTNELYENFTPLMNAIFLQKNYGNLQAAITNLFENVPVEDARKNLLFRNNLGYTAVHLAYLFNNDQNKLINIMEHYLDKFQIDVNRIMDKNKKSPLNWAALAQHIQ